MNPDEEGFLQPNINKDLCISCGMCEKICPVLHPGAQRKPLAVYAAKAKDDELRRISSSGGVFSALAEKIIMHINAVTDMKNSAVLNNLFFI